MLRLFLCTLLLLNSTVLIFAEEGHFNGTEFGTVYIALCNDDHVNVRELPSRAAKVTKQFMRGDKLYVLSTSKEKETIAGHTAYWFEVTDQSSYYRGWVFGQFIDGLPQSEALMPTVTRLDKNKGDSYTSYTIEISINNNGYEEKYTLNFMPSEFDPTIGLFVWMNDDKNFSWRDVPGVFLYDLKNKTVQHLSYRGETSESAWVKISFDRKFLLDDGGTMPGPRGLGIWRIPSEEIVFGGSYYGDLALTKENTVNIVDVYNPNGYYSKISEESLRYAKEFMRKNPYTGKDSEYLTVLVKYRLNFATGQRTFLACEYRLDY